jgi:hypothetical protein
VAKIVVFAPQQIFFPKPPQRRAEQCYFWFEVGNKTQEEDCQEEHEAWRRTNNVGDEQQWFDTCINNNVHVSSLDMAGEKSAFAWQTRL